LLENISLQQIARTLSDAATGAYSFDGVDADRTYAVFSYDYTGTYRAVVADNLSLANGGVELMP
jgi:hypothetical protein